MMISKPLFKQSVKANFTRWAIVTFASCFIVAVVIMILGNLNVNKIRGSLEDLFENSDKQAKIQYESVDSYQKTYDLYTEVLDKYKDLTEKLEKAIKGEASDEDLADFNDEFKDAIQKIRNGETEIASSKNKIASGEREIASSKVTYNSTKTEYSAQLKDLQDKQKQIEDGIKQCDDGLKTIDENLTKINTAIEQNKDTIQNADALIAQIDAGIAGYQVALSTAEDEEMKATINAKISELEQQKTNINTAKVLPVQMAALEQKKQETNAKKKELEENLAKVKSGISQINSGLASGQEKLSNAEITIYQSKEKLSNAESTLASSKEELRTKTLDALYDKIADGVYDEAIKENDEETAQKSKDLAKSIMDKYKAGENTSLEEIQKMAKNYVVDAVYDEAIKENSEEDSKLAKEIAATAIDEYNNKVANGTSKEDALSSISRSLIDQLPNDVEDAILEIKDLDVYGLVVGNILFRIAGLLLPMIFVIMTANGLLAGQVDSGSMAYILSTPTKRQKVTITQMVYLIASVLLMYICICATSVVGMLLIKDSEITITIEEMIKFNIGAFFVMFAVSGICYLASAIFNREKNSISVGGGITMFFLVCSILGLFGEDVIPSAIRIDAMNYFNYASIISLFNVHSMLAGTTEYISGLVILFAIGIIAYIIGIVKFDRKDLPL